MSPLYLVDGFNFLHAVVLKGKDRRGWWKATHQRRVVEFAERFRAAEAWVIFDAKSGEGERCEELRRVQVFFAPSADEFIVERCEELRKEREVHVVSADRSLVDRATHRGAKRLSPWKFATLCVRSTPPK